jgi:hypothetical protein
MSGVTGTDGCSKGCVDERAPSKGSCRLSVMSTGDSSVTVVSSQTRLALGLRPLAFFSSVVGAVTTQPSSSAADDRCEADLLSDVTLALGVSSPGWGSPRALGSLVPSVTAWLSDEDVGPGLGFRVSTAPLGSCTGDARPLWSSLQLLLSARNVSSCGVTTAGAGFPCFTLSFSLVPPALCRSLFNCSLRDEGGGDVSRESEITVRTVASL